MEKAYDTPLFSPKDLKKEFTDADAKKLFSGLFHKEPANAEKDAARNFAVGLELAAKSHPSDFNPSSQALAKIREQAAGRADLPLSDLKGAFCQPSYGLTESMVTLYVFALIKSGGFELVLKPNTGFTLVTGKALPSDRLTAHTLPLCEWNAKLDRALLGSRLVTSVHKGWNEVLPYARILDADLKTANTPDEEQARDVSLLTTLTKLSAEIPGVEKSMADLAAVLGGAVPQSLKEVCARLRGLAAAGSYQEFDAAARESWAEKETFAAAHEQYDKARRLRDRAFHLSQIVDYLGKACDVDGAVEIDRLALLETLKFGSLLNDPSVIGAREGTFEEWKARYVQTYRKSHRAYYEEIEELAAKLETLCPKVQALVRMNSIVELGPPLAVTRGVEAELKALGNALWVCPDSTAADVVGKDPLCPKCQWRPNQKPSAEDALSRLTTVVSQGLADRFQRFKDASIAAILKKATTEGKGSGLQELLDIIQLADADRLAGVLNDEVIAFLRKVLYDETLVDEQIFLGPILQQIGPIEETRVEEAVSTLTRFLTRAIKDAKAKHGPGKRVRVFLRTDDL